MTSTETGKRPARLRTASFLRAWPVFALAGLMVAGCQGGPVKIDFSGEWRLNTEKSRLEVQRLRNLEDAVLRIEHHEPTFKLHRTFVLGGQESQISFELTSNGKEVVGQEGQRKLFSRLHWEGDALIFTTRITDSTGEALNRVRYRLLENGRVLQAEERFQSPRLSYENLWVFDKR